MRREVLGPPVRSLDRSDWLCVLSPCGVPDAIETGWNLASLHGPVSVDCVR
jgi:hypothetical protein